MARYGASTVLLGLLKPGATVAISVWKLSDGSTVTLSSSACTEIGSTGIFRWATSNIQTQPTVETEYVYKMLNSGLATDFHMGKFALICPECYAPTKVEIRQEMDDNSTKLALLAGIDTDIDTIVADLDNPDQYKADISTLEAGLVKLKIRIDDLETFILGRV